MYTSAGEQALVHRLKGSSFDSGSVANTFM
jgi:hypothetical protein